MTQTVDARTARLREAIAKQDKKYLDGYEEGMDAGLSGKDRDPKRKSNQGWEDGYDAGQSQRPPDADEGEKMPGDEEVPEFGAGGGPSITVEDEEEFIGNPVDVGFHPLGGISVRVRAKDGTIAQARLTFEQASVTATHLQALATMLIEATYAQMAQMQQAAQQTDLLVPGR